MITKLFTLLRRVSAMPGTMFSFSRMLLPLMEGRGAASAGDLRLKMSGKVGSCSEASQCWWPRLAWDSTAGKLRTWPDM